MSCFSFKVQAEIKKSWNRRTLALDFKRKARSGSNTYSYGPMVSHTSVTNVTARGPLALHLTTRLGPAPVNGHRSLPGYVKNGSVSENSIPSSGQELHIPKEEQCARARPGEDNKPSPVVEEERETVMWIPESCRSEKTSHETLPGWTEGEGDDCTQPHCQLLLLWNEPPPTDEALEKELVSIFVSLSEGFPDFSSATCHGECVRIRLPIFF